MRFLAWRILGWILKEASMAAAACLFQKDGFSSSSGTGQTPISPSSAVPASPGHPCRVPCSRDICSLDTPMLEASSHVNQMFRGIFGVGGVHVGLHQLPGPRVLGTGTRGYSKTRHDGELSGKWNGAKSMVECGDRGYKHFPQTSPQHRSKQKPGGRLVQKPQNSRAN